VWRTLELWRGGLEGSGRLGQARAGCGHLATSVLFWLPVAAERRPPSLPLRPPGKLLPRGGVAPAAAAPRAAHARPAPARSAPPRASSYAATGAR
jgi:hypothetical protein